MRQLKLDRGSIPLIAIATLFLGTLVFLFLSLRSDSVEQAMKSDRILNIAVVVEREGRPASTQLFLLYPANGRGALLDVPGETGLIITSLNRVDRLDALYDRRRPSAYLDELSSLLATSIPYWMILDEDCLSSTTDLIDGIEVFIPAAVDDPGPPRSILPSGAVVLDGDKALQYASYKDPNEGEAEAAGRRQKLLQALFRRLGEKAAWIVRPDVFPTFRSSFRTNLSDDSLRRLIPEFARLDADRIVLQRVTGVYKNVDGKRLLFPHYDGELVRDIVKQTLNALANSGSGSPADKIFTIEIMNGTSVTGLAKRAAEIFQSFGYDVVSIGNADMEDNEKTVIVDRFANPDAAKSIGDVIRCDNIEAVQPASPLEAAADFSIVLGRDFNGRYCAK
jgi:anionic cell wall polymer biosynthesis LytR-Cps2A-Psr (LCP) family protein